MSDSKVVILDYGSGNLESIQQALREIEEESEVTNDRLKIRKASKLILPGVGAFPSAMKKLIDRGLVETIQEFAQTGKPLLGICLGMQLLMDSSKEFTLTKGLGLVQGDVTQLSDKQIVRENRRIPNVGWYEVKNTKENLKGSVLEGLQEKDSFYFVHSFVCNPSIESDVFGKTSFGVSPFCSVVVKENITGVQFHPEKSGKSGLRILENFANL